MIELYAFYSMFVFGVALLVWMMGRVLRASREARIRHRQALLDMIEHQRSIEIERQRHMDWLYRQAYGPPRLVVIQGDKPEECAVIPFRKPETD